MSSSDISAAARPLSTHFFHRWRFLIPSALVGLLLAPPTQQIALNVLSDAFFQVGVFVMATLCVYHLCVALSERLDTSIVARLSQWRIVFAAMLGALPGCGGAIIVITQFIRGQYSFGAVVAVLTATMGDAAFLLIAAIPADGALLMVIGLFVGIVSGYLCDAIFGKSFLRPQRSTTLTRRLAAEKSTTLEITVWKVALLPAIVISLLIAFQYDPNLWFGLKSGSVELFGGAFAVVAMFMWAKQSSNQKAVYQELVAEEDKSSKTRWFANAAQDTNFILTWAIAAFMVFEITVSLTNIDLNTWFMQWGALAPMLGVFVGLLPGCGPQILVTSLYINGAVPFSAQLGNAISNDGDALFPAIALAPKVAVIATLLSSVPALVVAYGYYWLFESI